MAESLEQEVRLLQSENRRLKRENEFLRSTLEAQKQVRATALASMVRRLGKRG